jgi:nicotinate-nucleotide pyrophosphorylase (carboxylating)
MVDLEKITSTLETALKEDIGDGDFTTLYTVPEDLESTGKLIAKQEGILAGIDVAFHVFKLLDSEIKTIKRKEDGEKVVSGEIIGEIQGNTRTILTGERVALNFLQRLCGIATLTYQFVSKIIHTNATLLDTRKTTPGLRYLEKYAVSVGQGTNHRFGLFDMIMIKENHIEAAGGITEAVNRVREKDTRNLKIEVETKNLEEVEEAVSLNVHRILLDNMDIQTLKKAVAMVDSRIPLEASGGINLETITAVAETGVDYISVGAVTHSAPSLDISLIIER